MPSQNFKFVSLGFEGGDELYAPPPALASKTANGRSPETVTSLCALL